MALFQKTALPSDSGADKLQIPPLGLYIHIPWCIRKCPYCDFNSHVCQGAIPEIPYIDALMEDLDQDLPLVTDRKIHSIFIGGGTPSLFSPEAIQHLIIGIQSKIAAESEIEITLEANPGTFEYSKFLEFRQAGITRLSIGVQSFNPKHLKALGRVHDGREAIRAAEVAHQVGLVNFNLDLMFGLPGQLQEDARNDIATATSLEPRHISCYQLTLEPHTLFFSHPPALPDDENIWAMQCQAQADLQQHGYLQYEISGYAKTGYQCRHNLNYWKFGDYLGIGAGAHGKITDLKSQQITRIWKSKRPSDYLKTAGTPESIGNMDTIPRRELILEFLMNALRLIQGFDRSTFESRTGLAVAALEPHLSDLLEEGLIEEQANRIRCTQSGRNFLNDILARFVQT